MFNQTTLALRDFYKYSFIDRIFIKLQTRALGAKFERLFILLPILIYMNTINQQKVLDNTKAFLLKNIEPKNLALKVYDRVMLKLFSYKDDNSLYIQDRKKAFDILRQNIQLYNVVDEILGDEFIEQKKMIEDIVRKQYDEAYSINEHNSKLLRFQEQHYS
ncbi:hypothetical protein CCY99_02490 [Helicobacter sp. 16-1353]|uniref:hypothetical protein n=1 Tax=Helicobacter sp. 16-1353 TaxID=2004996 RepID=UPI000DCE0445|nr:hypothetical protein [Helicobacter sp. 16-1353]RAX54651.1 hypothetical protein CCY99_02490 [Helicobacter sp. 16-1353]